VPEPTVIERMAPVAFAKTLMQTAAALDDFGFALATVEPEPDPEVDAELVRTARALASCVTGFGLRIGDYDLTLAALPPRRSCGATPSMRPPMPSSPWRSASMWSPSP